MGTLLQIIFGLFGLVIAVRYLPKDQFGIFVLIQVTATFFMILVSFAVQNISVTKFIASTKDNDRMRVANILVSYYLLFSLALSLITALLFLLVKLVAGVAFLDKMILYVPVFILLNGFYEFLLSVLQGFHKYREIGLSQVINGLAKILFILIFLVILKTSLFGLLLSFYLSFLVSIVYQLSALPQKIKPILDSKLLREVFSFGLPLSLNHLLTLVFTKIDRYMIGGIIGPTGVAYYEIASRIPDNGYRMFQSFHSVLFPNISELFARRRGGEAEHIINNSLRLISFGSAFITLIAFLFKEDIVRILFSGQYLISAAAFSILMLSMSTDFVGYILGATLIASGSPDKPVKINIISTTVNVCGNLILLPSLGFTGAAYAALAARAIANPIAMVFVKRKEIGISLNNYLKPLLALALCLLVFFVSGTHLVLYKLCLLALFLLICLGLSVVSSKDIVSIVNGLRRQTPANATNLES
jgi:O-antigen/teichoic acid export membrane protein